jgi:hypothetical protein
LGVAAAHESAPKVVKSLSRVTLCAGGKRLNQVPRRDLLRRISKRLAAEDDIGFTRILRPVMAHAFDAGYEQHARRKLTLQDLRIVPGRRSALRGIRPAHAFARRGLMRLETPAT